MRAPLIAGAFCLLAAAAEGVASGSDVKHRLLSLRQPRIAPPFWLWIIIGFVYYVVCFVVLTRLFQLPTNTVFSVGITLTLLLMTLNVLWSFAFFRLRSLGLSALIAGLYVPLAAGLLFTLRRLDRTAALAFTLYAAYLLYGSWWTFQVWRLNRRA